MIFKFHPILKPTIWGGDKIASLKQLPHAPLDIGESWEISGVTGYVSVVAEGKYAGCTLAELATLLKGNLVGNSVYQRFGNEFPLLVKFIDAHQNLSVQVHPDDEAAIRKGHPRGKAEMWYLLDSDSDAMLYCGFNESVSPERCCEMAMNGTICDVLAQYKVKEGDVFFLPAGRVHAIGAGCLIVEIQQTSDVTYRIYDYQRKDKGGRMRTLHLDEAIDVINYAVSNDYQTHYMVQKNHINLLVDSPYFITNIYDVDQPTTISAAALDTFVILIGLEGNGIVEADTHCATIKKGETLLIAAKTKQIVVEGSIKLLETHLE